MFVFDVAVGKSQCIRQEDPLLLCGCEGLKNKNEHALRPVVGTCTLAVDNLSGSSLLWHDYGRDSTFEKAFSFFRHAAGPPSGNTRYEHVLSLVKRNRVANSYETGRCRRPFIHEFRIFAFSSHESERATLWTFRCSVRPPFFLGVHKKKTRRKGSEIGTHARTRKYFPQPQRL